MILIKRHICVGVIKFFIFFKQLGRSKSRLTQSSYVIEKKYLQYKWTKINGFCQSGTKAATHDCKIDLTLTSDNFFKKAHMNNYTSW